MHLACQPEVRTLEKSKRVSRGTFPFTVNSNSTCKRLQQSATGRSVARLCLPRASVGLMSGAKEVQMPVHGAFAAPDRCKHPLRGCFLVLPPISCRHIFASCPLHAIVQRFQAKSDLSLEVLGVGWILHLKSQLHKHPQALAMDRKLRQPPASPKSNPSGFPCRSRPFRHGKTLC